MVTHLFALVNLLHNYDSIAQQPYGYGTGITSGRWFLSILGDFIGYLGGNYNLSLVNGLLFIILIAITAGFLVSVLEIRKRVSATLVGMLIVVFPSATSTLFFSYTAVYYGLAILLSVLAAWVLNKYKFGLLWSALCTALSLGIYQAYVPITISIFVLLLIREALEGKTPFWKLVRRGFFYCGALILGLLLYYVFLKISLVLYGTSLSNYQGVDSMGKLSLRELPGLIKEAIYGVCMLPVKGYCDLAGMKLIKLAYLLLGGCSMVIMGYILLVKVKKADIIVFTILLCPVLLLAVNFVVIMCPDTWIYTLMVYAFVLLPCAPLMLLECLPEAEEQPKWMRKILRNGVAIAAAVMTCCYAYEANVSYTALYYANHQVENYLNSIVVQVRMTDGFDTEKEWAFLGDIEDPLLNCYWRYETKYGGSEFTPWLLNRYSRNNWIQNYYGYSVPEASDEKIAVLSAMEEVKQMPCWPDAGSIKVVGDTVVIKFQELNP